MPSLRKMTVRKDILAIAHTWHLSPIPEPRFKDISILTDVVDPSQVAQILVSLQPSLWKVFYLRATTRVAFHNATLSERLNPYQQLEIIARRYTSCNSASGDGWSRAWLCLQKSILLRPLFAFSNLRYFVLVNYVFDFTDADVRELAMPWPFIEELHVDEPDSIVIAGIKPRTTFRCLLWFAIYCRKLTDLSFNFTGIDILGNRARYDF